MAYGDTTDPKNRVISIVLVGLLTVTMGYGLVNGLNISVVKKIAEKLDVVDIKEETPPEEPPPPPPPDTDLPPPPPVVTPPSPFPPPQTTNVVESVREAPPAPPPPVYVPPAAPVAPPPPAVDRTAAGTPRGNPGRWATNDDYPARAMRDGREGTTGFRVTYGADGRITSCDITSSSGHDDLDAETCKLITRRGRFNPGKDRDGNAAGGTYSNRIRWQIPQ
jgi:protein TonB